MSSTTDIIMTEVDHFFVAGIKQVLLRKEMGLGGEVKESAALCEVGMKAKKETHCHPLKS